MGGRRWRWAWALVALTVGASACGGGAADRAAVISAGGIARAAQSTGEEGTARIAMTVEVAGQTIDVDGAMRMDGSALVMSFDVPGGGRFEERIVDEVLYMRAPGADVEFGTEWVSVDMSGLLPDQQEAARSTGTADPTSSLQSLAGAAGEVKMLGEEEVRGGIASHYRVHLDADTALERLRARGTEPTEQQLETLEAMDGEPMDVWLDGEDRMVKMAFAIRFPQGTARMTMELYDFGASVDIQAPPASDTTDITDRMRAELIV